MTSLPQSTSVILLVERLTLLYHASWGTPYSDTQSNLLYCYYLTTSAERVRNDSNTDFLVISSSSA